MNKKISKSSVSSSDVKSLHLQSLFNHQFVTVFISFSFSVSQDFRLVKVTLDFFSSADKED
jgi:hypothetical protein